MKAYYYDDVGEFHWEEQYFIDDAAALIWGEKNFKKFGVVPAILYTENEDGSFRTVKKWTEKQNEEK